MAITVADLIARLSLHDAQFKKQLRSVNASIAEAAKIAQQTGRTLTTHITLPITAAAAAAVKLERDFRATLTRTQTLAGESAAGVSKLKNELLALAPAVGKGPNELARALLVVESVGISGAEALEVVTASAKAAAVGLGDTAVVARAVTAALRTYGKDGLTAAQATDQLLAAVRLGGAEADEFAGSLGRVLAISKQLGVSFAEVTGFVATFTRLGVDADEATTALRGTLASLAKPTRESEEALGQMGKTVQSLRKEIKDRGLAVTLIDLVLEAERLGVEISSVIPNVRALAGVLANAAAQGDDYADIIREIEQAMGELDSAFEATLAAGVLAFDQLKAAGEALLITFAEESGLAGAAQKLAEALANIAIEFRSLDPEFKAAVGVALTFAAAIGPLALGLSAVATVIRYTLLPAIALLAAALGPGAGLAAAIVVLLGSAKLLTYAWDDLADAYERSLPKALTAEEAHRSLAGALDEVRAKALSAAKALEIVNRFGGLDFSRQIAVARGAVVSTAGALTAAREAGLPTEHIQALEQAFLRARGELSLLIRTLDEAVPPLEKTEESTKKTANAAKALSEEQMKARAELEKNLEELQREAAVQEGRAKAMKEGKEALAEFNEQVALSAALTKVLADAIEADLTGDALQKMIVDTANAVRQLHAANNEIERTEEATREAAKAAEDARRDAEREAERTAEALAEPFKNAFRDMQTTFTDAFEGMLTGAITSWKDFFGQLKSIATRLLANVFSNVIFGGLANSLSSSLGGGGAGGGGASSGGPLGFLSRIFGSGGSTSGGGIGGLLSSLFTPGQSSLFNTGAQIGNALQSLFGGGTVQGPVTASGTPPLSTLGSIGGTLGDALGGIGGLLVGVKIGSNLATDYAIERISTKVGSYLGGIVGLLVGAYFGGTGGATLGGAVGGIAGGALFRGAGGVVGATLAGQSIYKASTRQQVFDRQLVINLGAGPLGAAIGGLVGQGGSPRKSILATGASSIDPVIGALLSSIFLREKFDNDLGIGTFATLAQAQAASLGRGEITEGPFGFLAALAGLKSGDLKSGTVIGGVGLVEAIDKALAKALRPEDLEKILDAGLADILISNPKNLSGKIAAQRVGSVLSTLGFSQNAIGTIGASPDFTTTRGLELIQARNEVFAMIDALNGVVEVAPKTKAAFAELEAALDAIAAAAPAVGIDVDIDALRTTAKAKLREGFDDVIEASLLSFTNPLELALKNLSEEQRLRYEEAEALEANLTEVLRLNALEREQLLEQAFAPIDELLKQIRSGVGLLPGVEVEERAREAFNVLASQVSAGQFVDPAELAESARLFLDASRAINASSVAFFNDLALVEQILAQARGNLPGFATGGSFTIPGSGYENVVPLFRASGGESVSILSRGQKQSSETAIKNLILELAEGRATNRDVLTVLEQIRDEMAQDRSEVKRLSRIVSGTARGGIVAAGGGGGGGGRPGKK